MPLQATFCLLKVSTTTDITLRNLSARAMETDATAEKEDKISITKEEYDRLKQQAEASSKASSAIGPSPPKKSKSEDTDWAQFMETLAERDIELMDLDPQLRQTLKENPQARKDFQQLHLKDPNVQHFNPETGAIEDLNMAKKRLFDHVDQPPTLDKAENEIKEAMIQYHSGTVLPNFQALYQACHEFYLNTTHELYYSQMKQDMVDTRLKALEARQSNKTVLVKGLPAHGYNKTQLENNVYHFMQRAGLEWECLASMHTHTLSTSNSIMRLEFMTEMQKNQFFQHMRTTKNIWRIWGEDYGKAKVEHDISTDDRLAQQPFYTILDILPKILDTDMVGQHNELQSDRNTLQIWPDKNSKEQKLLSQVVYLLDLRFPRRYVCVIFIDETYGDDLQQHWMEHFSERMKSALMTIQALSRAASDRTTLTRHQYDKAFDIANVRHPHQHFPYPIIFMGMSASLAALLSAHPSLPMQGAAGLHQVVQQVFFDYKINPEAYGKGAKSGGKGKTMLKGKTKTKAKSGRTGPDRAPDQTKYTKDDKQDPSSGQGQWPAGYRSSGLFRAAHQNSTKDTGKGSSHQSKGKGKHHGIEVIICQICMCALGWNAGCAECSSRPLPPGFTTKGTAAVGTMWCPGQTASGQCDNTLGLGGCELCVAHRLHWSHEQNLRQDVTAAPEAVAKMLQLDRFLHHYNLLTDDDFSYFLDELQAESHGNIDEYGHEEWASSWILEAFDSSNFLPLAKTGKLAFEMPEIRTAEAELHNAGLLFDVTVTRELFFMADFFSRSLGEHWRYYFHDIARHWKLDKAMQQVSICRTGVLPWDALVAASANFAIQEHHLLGYEVESKPSGWNRTFTDLLHSSICDGQRAWHAMTDAFVRFLHLCENHVEIFLGVGNYHNEPLRQLSAFSTCFTDLCYWQLAAIFELISKPRSQLQIPNESLVELYVSAAKSVKADKQTVQWALTRHWNNRGNSVEVLLMLMAEQGHHLQFWQTLWVLFLHQHRSSGHFWVEPVF